MKIKKLAFVILAISTISTVNVYAADKETKRISRDCVRSVIESKRTSLKQIATTLRSCLDSAEDTEAKKACRQTARNSRDAKVESSRDAIKNCRNSAGL